MAKKSGYIFKGGLFIAVLFIATSHLQGQTANGDTREPYALISGNDTTVMGPEYLKEQVVALRTNLLADIVGAANIGIEVPIGDRFSVAGDFAYAHTRIGNRFALQAIQGTIEGRYWFKQRRNKLTGWNVGTYGTYNSRFDVQWGGGWQGDGYWSVGVSGGYSLPIAENFNIDFSLMGGYLYSPEIRKYSKPRDGHLMWEETRYDVSRLALTQVRVNLVWLINKKRHNR